MHSQLHRVRHTDETIIDLIRVTRNNLIKTFFLGNNLQQYIQAHHPEATISVVRLEFMKRSLQELLIAPVDLTHYGKLILEIRDSSDQSISLQNHASLFTVEINRALQNYIY